MKGTSLVHDNGGGLSSHDKDPVGSGYQLEARKSKGTHNGLITYAHSNTALFV